MLCGKLPVALCPNISGTSLANLFSDTIRKIDFEMARHSKLLGTLSSRIDAIGLHDKGGPNHVSKNHI